MEENRKASPVASQTFANDLFEPAPLPTAPLNDAQRLACLRLIRSENVGPVTFRALINHYGGAEQALDALPEIARRGNKRAIKICPKDRAEAELEDAQQKGVTPLFTIEPGYPEALAHLEVPPPLIYTKGNVELFNQHAIAVVGARQASAAGLKLTHTFVDELAKTGFVITSGLARGIDGAAHKAALAHGTIAVLAGGLDIIYPPEHEKLHEQIAEQGCLVSEMPCGFQPRSQDFPRRNRIISGLSLGVLVIEAARRSGSLVTARYSTEQNREVFAVPGHPLDPRANGTNQLLKSGATLVTEAQDILDVLSPLTGTLQNPSSSFREAAHTMPAYEKPSDTNLQSRQNDHVASTPFDDNENSSEQKTSARERLLEALSPAPIDIDTLSRTTNLSVRDVNIILLELDLAGRIIRHGQQLVSLAANVEQAENTNF